MCKYVSHNNPKSLPPFLSRGIVASAAVIFNGCLVKVGVNQEPMKLRSLIRVFSTVLSFDELV